MFETFKICDVFSKIETPKIKAKANDFPTEYSDEYCIPLLTAGAENQGLNRYARVSDCPLIISNVISVSANGANSGICFYQPHNFAVLQDAYAINVNGREIANTEEGLYLTGALNKAIKDNHDWTNKAGWNRIKDDSIELPVIENPNPGYAYTVGDIDWQYMRDRIAELERDRIAELDAYLKVTGLDDYELNDEDKAVLCMSDEKYIEEFVGDIIWKKVKVGNLFDFEVGNLDIKKEHINGKGIRVVSSGVANRGIIGKTDVSAKVLPANTITVDMFGNVFYRDAPYKMVTHARVFSLLPNMDIDSKIGEYFESKLHFLTDLFDYNNMCSFSKIKDMEIELPFTSTGELHKTYIYIYIRAIEKTIIKEMLIWKDQQLEILRKIV